MLLTSHVLLYIQYVGFGSAGMDPIFVLAKESHFWMPSWKWRMCREEKKHWNLLLASHWHLLLMKLLHSGLSPSWVSFVLLGAIGPLLLLIIFYWSFVRGIHRSLVNSSHKGLWCFLWPAPWINGWVNNRDASDFGTPWGSLWRHYIVKNELLRCCDCNIYIYI